MEDQRKRQLAKSFAVIGIVTVIIWELIVMTHVGRIPLDIGPMPSSPVQFIIFFLFAVFLATSSIFYEELV